MATIRTFLPGSPLLIYISLDMFTSSPLSSSDHNTLRQFLEIGTRNILFKLSNGLALSHLSWVHLS